MRHVIVGTAGHIDHGKSALILALTGTDPDRWEEEKRRGITIDLGFAHLDLGPDLRIGFIDVPGHERFVKNMLAGVGGIDLVMLIVAGDESIKPQTREHFDICKLLGIRRGLIVITKSDLVEREVLDLVHLEVQEFVAGSFLAGAPIVDASSRTGEGLDELKNQLRRLSLEAPPKPADLPFRLPIDRSFVIKGFGSVVTGTLIAGTVEKEAEVEIFPLGKRARVRGIEVYNAPADRATAGQRTALNLAGTEAKQMTRGMVLAAPGLFQPTTCLDCTLSLLPTARPLKNHAQVHFHCGTAEMLARVVVIEGKEMKPGATGFVQLRLSEPGLFVPGDRFIIRQFSPVTTIGGGGVLDNAPPKHRPGDPITLESLRLLERGEPEARIELLAQRAGEATPADLAARTGWKPAEILRVAKSLEAQKRLVLLGQPPSLLVHAAHFERLTILLLEQLGKFHAANPLVPGLPKEELRAKLGARGAAHAVPSAALHNALLQFLTTQGKIDVQGEMVRLGGRTIQLSAEEVAARDQIAAAFEKAGLAVPSAQEVLANLRLDRARAEKLLRILLKENVLHKVTEDLIFHQAALRELRAILARRKVQNNRLGVTDFKELTGLSRKYAIPLLEYLDRERVTRREGGERIIL
jgi:selenocysteine-specific elongation factor